MSENNPWLLCVMNLKTVWQLILTVGNTVITRVSGVILYSSGLSVFSFTINYIKNTAKVP